MDDPVVFIYVYIYMHIDIDIWIDTAQEHQSGLCVCVCVCVCPDASVRLCHPVSDARKQSVTVKSEKGAQKKV